MHFYYTALLLMLLRRASQAVRDHKVRDIGSCPREFVLRVLMQPDACPVTGLVDGLQALLMKIQLLRIRRDDAQLLPIGLETPDPGILLLAL